MGRYKDYDRGPRRGYDGDQKSEGRAPGGRPKNPSLSAPKQSGSVEAIVKWFNAEKGFGFVAVVGGSEAFLHIRQLEAAGHNSEPEGARVKVRIGQGQKGPEVSEVTEVDLSTAQSGSSAKPRPATCACRKSNSRVLVMQTAEDRSAFDAPNGLNEASDGCVLAKGKMRARCIVVLHVARQYMTQVPLSENDDVVKAFLADRADQALRTAILPG